VSDFRVALTFDTEHPDRPARPGTTETMLDVLAGRNVRATFFIQGRWAEAYPPVVQRIAADGHLIGNHSHYHARMPLLTDEGIAADLNDAEAALLRVADVNPRPWFRCPFGAGADDTRVQAAIAAAGYRHVGWHVDVHDWEPTFDAATVEERAVAGALAHGDGAVVLLHGWPSATLGALDGIVRRLTEAGASFSRVDELTDVPSGVTG
jgi:peptidoglycan/xylan/chitin deacetylase (PgdA/CDA1 family)